MDSQIGAEQIVSKWESIAASYTVPRSLYQHQIDTIMLLLQGKHVFCSSPTGSGKTLAQLTAVLFTSGKGFCLIQLYD